MSFIRHGTRSLPLRLISKLMPDAVLGGVTLPASTFTATSKTVVEGNTITIRYLGFLDGQDDADFPPVEEWSQLQLDSVTAVIQYKTSTMTTSITDFTASDIRYSGYVWHGEHASDTDAGDVLNVNTVYFRTSDLQWRGVSANVGGTTTWANFDQSSGLLQPASWLGSLSDAELTTYFENNDYDSSRNYYFYQESSSEVRKYAETSTDTWTDFAMSDDIDGVEFDELTVDTSLLQNFGILRMTLADDSIMEDVMDKFRVSITLTQS